MCTYVVFRVPEPAIAVRVHAQVRGSTSHKDAVVLVVSEQRAPTRVSGTPLHQKCVGVELTVLQSTATGSLQEALVQIPVGDSAVFLYSFFGKRHPHFAVLGDITRLGSGI